MIGRSQIGRVVVPARQVAAVQEVALVRHMTTDAEKKALEEKEKAIARKKFEEDATVVRVCLIVLIAVTRYMYPLTHSFLVAIN